MADRSFLIFLGILMSIFYLSEKLIKNEVYKAGADFFTFAICTLIFGIGYLNSKNDESPIYLIIGLIITIGTGVNFFLKLSKSNQSSISNPEVEKPQSNIILKCKECGETFPSKYYFEVPAICKDCFKKLPIEQQATLRGT